MIKEVTDEASQSGIGAALKYNNNNNMFHTKK